VSDETNNRIVASPNRHQTSTPRFLLIVALRFSFQPASARRLWDGRASELRS
jgi:hypothetical protein